MKKHILSTCALVLALAAVVLAVFACLEIRMQTARLDALEAALQTMQSQTDETLPVPTETPDAPTVTGDRYSNLYLGDWSCEGSTLTLTTASAQVISTPGCSLDSAALILEVNGTAFSTVILDLYPGEAADSYELDLSGFSLELPELVHGDHLDLRLEAYFSDGTMLTAWGGSWDWENGRLLMIAG